MASQPPQPSDPAELPTDLPVASPTDPDIDAPADPGTAPDSISQPGD